MKTQVQQTSLFAFFNEIKPTLGERQKAIYNTLRTRKNFTNTELSEYLGFPINTVTPRIGELRKLGLVRQSEIRKCKVTGRIVISWEIII